MKTAVLLFGVVHRSLGHVVSDLRKFVLEPLAKLGTVDVSFHSWSPIELESPRTGECGMMVRPEEVEVLLPEARGVFESQDELDASVDWEPLFERNPMRHCSASEEAARASLMNHFRALESLERAWRFFQERNTGEYDRMVATRPDLRFLHKLVVPAGCATEREDFAPLWVPRFHGWGGVNDRFVMGREREVGIWCRRSAFARECVLADKGWNSETMLMKWLEQNRVPVRFLNFVFQRVRATGEVAELDRGLSGARRGSRQTGDSAITWEMGDHGGSQPAICRRDRFLILARAEGQAAESLRKVLEPLGKVEVVVDQVRSGRADRSFRSPYVWIPDEEAEGFGGLMSSSGSFPWVTAWSRALCHLSRTFEEDEAIWFVEDDVAGDAGSFAALVRETAEMGVDLAAMDVRTREADAHWPYWGYADGFFSEAARAFQPMCRLSGRLVRAVLDCREQNGRCTFHEVMFPSVAREQGMSWLSWCREAALKRHFGEFHYRPAVTSVGFGVSHPVKEPEVHRAVCALASVVFPEIRPEPSR